MPVPCHLSNLPFIPRPPAILQLLLFILAYFSRVHLYPCFEVNPIFRHADACFVWTFIWKWSVFCLQYLPFAGFDVYFFGARVWCFGKLWFLCFYIWIFILSAKVVRRFFFFLA